MLSLCAMFIRKIEHKDLIKIQKTDESKEHQTSILSTSPSNNMQTHNFLEDSISMLERTAVKLYPILKEALKKMIEESPHVDVENHKLPAEIEYEKISICEDADMRSVLGFLNQNEWIYNLNIGNIMQI